MLMNTRDSSIVNNSLHSDDYKKCFNRSLTILTTLITGLKEERLAIEKIDTTWMQEVGDHIEGHLNELSVCFPTKDEITDRQSEILKQLLDTVHLMRSENETKLKAMIKSQGDAIKNITTGRRTLKAYKNLKADEKDLFIKKKC